MGALRKPRLTPQHAIFLDNSVGAPFMSTPDPLDVANSSAMVVYIDAISSDWTPSTDRIWIQHGDVDGNLAWEIALLTNGNWRLSYFDLGTIASRVSVECVPPFTLINNRRYKFGFAFLSSLFSAVSAYQMDVWEGLRVREDAIRTAALVGTAFDCTGPLNVGVGTGIESIYDFSIWGGKFGRGQIQYSLGENNRPLISSDINLQPLNTNAIGSWTSKSGHVWSLDGAAFERSESPLYPYAA